MQRKTLLIIFIISSILKSVGGGYMKMAETDTERGRAASFPKNMQFALKTTYECIWTFAVIFSTVMEVTFDTCSENK